MKNLKTILMASFLTVGIFSTAVFTSCNQDKCKDTVCQNAGTCNSVDGSCNCQAGYEGTNCETLSKTKFIKNWSASDVQGANTLVYSCAIGSGANANSAIISNAFSDAFFVNTIAATVDKNIITIPAQEPDNDGYQVSGAASFSANQLTWDYTIKDLNVVPNQSLQYHGTWL